MYLTKHYIPPPPPSKAPVWPRPFLIVAANLIANPICPWATCMEAHDPLHNWNILITLTCKRWGCPICARQKVRCLAAKTMLAAPNRLLTLTIDPSLYSSPRNAFEQTAHQVPELIRKLRDRFGLLEYLRVTEVTKKGWPHYHLLVRSDFIPQPVVKKLWADLTGAIIVDLRQVNKTFSAYSYLVKYLTKLHRLEWTERHVSYSKQFFPEECNQKSKRRQLTCQNRIPDHPYTWLCTWYNAAKITQLSPTVWRLDCPPSKTPDHVNTLAIGVANTKEPACAANKPP
jgi:hypothetical protein